MQPNVPGMECRRIPEGSMTQLIEYSTTMEPLQRIGGVGFLDYLGAFAGLHIAWRWTAMAPVIQRATFRLRHWRRSA